LAEFDDALKLDERFVYGLWGRGTIYRERGEYELAIQNFTQALRFTTEATELAELYNERGITYYQKEDYNAALADYDRAIDKKNDVAGYYGNRGDALGQLGRYDDAFAALDKAISLDAKNGDFWNIAGNIWFQRERYDIAIRMYANAIQTDGRVAMYYRNRGGAYRKAGNAQAAIADYLKAVELTPREDEAWNELGLAWYEAARYADAVTAFTKALELKSDSAVYLYNRGDAYQKLGQHEQAIADLTKSLEVEDSPDTHALRGNSYQALGNLDAAKADYEAAGDASGYEHYKTKYIRVINDSGGPLSVHLRYYTLTDTGKWKWFPEDGSSLIYSFTPGESGVLFHEDWKVHASRVRLWAYGERASWTEGRDKDISVAPEGGYLSSTGRETWVVPFRQVR
jgi:tetratricopeptide (TPR) repeat protein